MFVEVSSFKFQNVISFFLKFFSKVLCFTFQWFCALFLFKAQTPKLVVVDLVSALVMFFCYCFLLFRLCFILVATSCGLGHVFLLLLFVALITFFCCCFACLLLLLFASLVVLNGLSKGVCDQGNGFSERNNVPNGSSIENKLLCFVFGFEIPTTSISLAKNHAITNCLICWQKTKIFENVRIVTTWAFHVLIKPFFIKSKSKFKLNLIF
jgi:hypothetical protein